MSLAAERELSSTLQGELAALEPQATRVSCVMLSCVVCDAHVPWNRRHT
jgi:hypothetical protein